MGHAEGLNMCKDRRPVIKMSRSRECRNLLPGRLLLLCLVATVLLQRPNCQVAALHVNAVVTTSKVATMNEVPGQVYYWNGLGIYIDPG